MLYLKEIGWMIWGCGVFYSKKRFDIYGVENIVLGFVIIRFFVGNDK